MDANQYGINQGTFRVSSVLRLYIGRSKGSATLVKLLPFCVIVTKSSILDDGQFFDSLLLGSCLTADLIAPHVTQLTTLPSEPACGLIQLIEIDYNFIELEDLYLFDIAGKRFIKESGSVKGSLRAFIRYEYSESKKPNPAPFIEGTHFHFAIFSDSNQLISKLKKGPKGFYLQLSSYCHDQICITFYHA